MTREEEIENYLQKIGKGKFNAFAFDLGFESGVEWADKHPHWISVDERLPKDDSEVACLTADGEIYIDRYVRGTMYGNIWRKTERKPVKWLPLKAKKGE